METNPMTKFTEQMMAANQQMMDSAMRLGQMAMEAEGELMRHRMSAFDVISGADAVDMWKDVTTPAEFLSKSNEISASYGENMSAWVRKDMELQAEVAKRMADAIQEEMAKTTSAMMGTAEVKAPKRKKSAA